MKILTFDIEEWFHILDYESSSTKEDTWLRRESRIEWAVESILELLEKHKRGATFFCLGWVARKHPQVVRRIVDEGYEIGSHSDGHGLAYEQTASLFRQDLRDSVHILEDVSGTRVRAYRAPGFSLTERSKWVFEELQAEGIEFDCSVFPAVRAHGGYPSFGTEKPSRVNVNGGIIKEFPLNTASLFGFRFVFSGGGYFRLIPYRVTKALLRRSDYVMAYFHPRDMDVGQPRIEGLSLLRRFRTYYGISGCQRKLERMLSEFDFVSLGEADKRVDWERSPTVTI